MDIHNYEDENQKELTNLIEDPRGPEDSIDLMIEKVSNTGKYIMFQILTKDRMIIPESTDEDTPF